MNSYKDLIVWQKSLDLVENIYVVTNQLPKSETFALSSQMQRASVSIPSNIAEGYVKNHRPEFLHFLRISLGSATELETQLLIIDRLYRQINTEYSHSLLTEVLKMLNKMISTLERQTKTL